MRFSISGIWKLSGDAASVQLTAADEDTARRYAGAVGIIALDVRPVEEEGEPEPAPLRGSQEVVA